MKKDVKDNVLVKGLAEAIDWHVELCSLQQEKDFHSLLKEQLVKQQSEINSLKTELYTFYKFSMMPLLHALAGRDFVGHRDVDIKKEAAKLSEELIKIMSRLDKIRSN